VTTVLDETAARCWARSDSSAAKHVRHSSHFCGKRILGLYNPPKDGAKGGWQWATLPNKVYQDQRSHTRCWARSDGRTTKRVRHSSHFCGKRILGLYNPPKDGAKGGWQWAGYKTAGQWCQDLGIPTIQFYMYWTRVWNSWLCCTYHVHSVNQWTSAGLRRATMGWNRSQKSRYMFIHIHPHKNSVLHPDVLCPHIHPHIFFVFILLCRPPRRRSSCEQTHNAPPVDARHALIGQALLLMLLNPFERVTVSLQHAIMLHRCWECNLSCNINSIFCTKV